MENSLATSQENQSALPEAWVDKLFRRFAAMYGKHWFDQWNDVPMEDVKACWRNDLAHVDGDQIRKALDHCRAHNPFPPTCPEFVGLCKAFSLKLDNPRLPSVRYGGEIDPRIRAEIAKFLDASKKRDPKSWAREILTLEAEGKYPHTYGVECAKRALGLMP